MSFENIINQNKAKKILTGQLKSGRISHAYLFLGPDGVGRKKTALELAKALNCIGWEKKFEPCGVCLSCTKIEHSTHPDVQVIDFGWQAKFEEKEVEKQKVLKIDTIRALQREISFKPSEGRWKIFIVEPAEKITIDAANCLLKTLEEPPPQTVLILLAKHKENLPATVVSRTQLVMFQPLAKDEIVSYLKSNCSVTKSEAEEIAKISEGSLSWAIARADSKNEVSGKIWEQLTQKRMPVFELLSLSQKYSKNAQTLLDELLLQAKNDFRAKPHRLSQAIESLTYSGKLLERNVNSQMVLDALLLKLNKSNNQL